MRDSPSLPAVSDEADVAEERLPSEKEMTITKLRYLGIVKEVARRRRRLGTDLWKEVTRREHRVRRTQG